MVRKALGPTNQTFETLAGIQLPKYVNGLFIGSTDGRTVTVHGAGNKDGGEFFENEAVTASIK
jgi:hypothetical protein